jgi:hypothetical protein
MAQNGGEQHGIPEEVVSLEAQPACAENPDMHRVRNAGCRTQGLVFNSQGN